MINKKAIIFGIKGHKLNNKQKLFLKKTKPWGIILFSRNIKNLNQLTKLVNEIKKIFNNKNYPILIDLEGGKVSRINNIIDLTSFSQSYFAKLYSKNRKVFFNHYKIYIDTVSNILRSVGININTVPVLDVMRDKSHHIIGSRSFSKNHELVSKLGNICIDLYKKNKIATVMKHIPGHGLSKSDSHFKTPIVKEKKNILSDIDFKPFKKCKPFFAMTAHIIYKSIDSVNTATHSSLIIKQIIRKNIKFKGLLISDDISMKALKFDLRKNALTALESGCNLVLHCSGDLREMKKIAKVIPKIDKFTEKKNIPFL